jgi:hypothetical protein
MRLTLILLTAVPGIVVVQNSAAITSFAIAGACESQTYVHLSPQTLLRG